MYWNEYICLNIMLEFHILLLNKLQFKSHKFIFAQKDDRHGWSKIR